MYSLVKGEKTFYNIKPTDHNMKQFRKYTASQAKIDIKHFLKALDGWFNSIVLHQGQTIFLGPNLIHMVVTNATSIAFGVNFVHTAAISPAAAAFVRERSSGTPYQICYPNFLHLAICDLTMSLNGIGRMPVSEHDKNQFVQLWNAILAPNGFKPTRKHIADLIGVHKATQENVGNFFINYDAGYN
jgi:hypothetical protein